MTDEKAIPWEWNDTDHTVTFGCNCGQVVTVAYVDLKVGDNDFCPGYRPESVEGYLTFDRVRDGHTMIELEIDHVNRARRVAGLPELPEA